MPRFSRWRAMMRFIKRTPPAIVTDSKTLKEQMMAEFEVMSEDKCRWCGSHIGFGVEWLHIGVCDERRCQLLQTSYMRFKNRWPMTTMIIESSKMDANRLMEDYKAVWDNMSEYDKETMLKAEEALEANEQDLCEICGGPMGDYHNIPTTFPVHSFKKRGSDGV